MTRITGRVQGWHVTNDGVDVTLHLTVSSYARQGWRHAWQRRFVERELALTLDPRDASDAGYRLDQETGQIDASCSAIDDRDEARDEALDGAA